MVCSRNSCTKARPFDRGTGCKVNILKDLQRTKIWLAWIWFKTMCISADTIAAGSDMETASCPVSASSRQTSSCSVSNRMSHGHFENIIMWHCTTAGNLRGHCLHMLKHPGPHMSRHVAVPHIHTYFCYNRISLWTHWKSPWITYTILSCLRC